MILRLPNHCGAIGWQDSGLTVKAAPESSRPYSSPWSSPPWSQVLELAKNYSKFDVQNRSRRSQLLRYGLVEQWIFLPYVSYTPLCRDADMRRGHVIDRLLLNTRAVAYCLSRFRVDDETASS